MPKFMFLMKMTPEGAKLGKDWPAAIDNALNTSAQMGAKTLGFYACSALYDFIAIGEGTSAESAEMLRQYLVAAGLVEVQVVRLFDKDEFEAIIGALNETS